MDATPFRHQRPGGIALHGIAQGQGAPLILLHGGLGDCSSWAPQFEAFSPHFRTIAYSRRHSSPNANPLGHTEDSPNTDVEDLATLLRALKCGPAHLVGTSYGALVALVFALRHPEYVRSLVLAEPPLHAWVRRTAAGESLYTAFMHEVWHAAGRAFERGDTTAALRLLVDGIWGRPLFDTLPPERRAVVQRNAAAMEALLRSPLPFAPLSRKALAHLAMPVLLLNGASATPIHRAAIDELARALTGAQRAVIDDAGHGSPAENPGAFNRVVLDFLLAGPAPS